MAYDLLEAWEPLGLINVSGLAGYGWTFSGTQNIVSGQQRSGTRCLEHGGLPDFAQFPLPAGGTKSCGLAFKYTTGLVPDARANPIFYFQFASGNPIWVRLNGAGVLTIVDNTTDIAVGTTPLNVGTYYYLEAVCTSAGNISVYLNYTGAGAPVAEVSATFPARGNINIFRIGWFSTISNASMPVQYYDDIYVDDTGALYGDAAVLYDFPTGNDTPQDWVPSSGNAWERIDNVPLDAAQYIEATVAGDTSSFDFGGYTETLFQVHGAALNVNWLRTGAGIETARQGVKVGGTDYFGTTATVPQTTAEWRRDYWQLNPATGTQWLPADFQGGSIATLDRVS